MKKKGPLLARQPYTRQPRADWCGRQHGRVRPVAAVEFVTALEVCWNPGVPGEVDAFAVDFLQRSAVYSPGSYWANRRDRLIATEK